jgi:hypothetical protein
VEAVVVAIDPANFEYRNVAELKSYARNARRHSRKQIGQIAESIRRFGFNSPVLIDDDDQIICGHARARAAAELGIASIPTIRLPHLRGSDLKAYILTDNKLALNASWDVELLAEELQFLLDDGFDVSLTGFELAEIDIVLDDANDAAPAPRGDSDDLHSPLPANPVCRRGDIWQLGRHRLVCGDARSKADYEALLNGDSVDMIFTDPPYNVPIDGHVCGSGHVRHREFAMASGEMSPAAFTAFLAETLGQGAGQGCRRRSAAPVPD